MSTPDGVRPALTENPASCLELASARRDDEEEAVKTFTDEEIEKVLPAAQAHSYEMWLIALLGFRAGLREGEICGLQRLRVAWGRILKAAGVGYRRFHCTRHTYASKLLAVGAPMKYAQEQLGHASIAITMDIYGHLAPKQFASFADTLDSPLTLGAATRIIPLRGEGTREGAE